MNRVKYFVLDKLNRISRKNASTYRVYPLMISVVVPVYNTALYLSEMIDSILQQKQDILGEHLEGKNKQGNLKNVYCGIYELILVDDGSDDGSETICDQYAERYPWIQVIHKEHEGVSSARNAGIEYATGKYITFPDSDDILSPNVFEDCFLYLESNEEISLVTYPVIFFEGQTGEHWTCYRFKDGTRTLDLHEEWDKPQYFAATSFFKRELITKEIRFDKQLVNGEDFKFVHQYMFNSSTKIGLVATCIYHYRRRLSGQESAIQKSKKTKEYYLYINDLLFRLKEESEKKFGYFPKFVQYAIMGQLQWRLRSDERGEQALQILDADQYDVYRSLIRKMISYIDYEVILSQKHLLPEHLYYACSCKSSDSIEKRLEANNIDYYFSGHYCANLRDLNVLIKKEDISVDTCIIHGEFATFEKESVTYLEIGENLVKTENILNDTKCMYVLGIPIVFVYSFDLNVYVGREEASGCIRLIEIVDDYKVIRKEIVL